MVGDARTLTKRLGGQWMGRSGLCCCPVHKDKRPSLQVSDGAEGIRVHCHAGCDWRTVKDAIRNLGGSGHSETPILQSPMETDSERINRARAIWAAASPILGTPGELYFRNRGISCPLPESLRYASALKHPGTGLMLPAVVAAICIWPARRVTGIHRTFIRADGSGKAPVSAPKAMLGICRGGAVRLSAAGTPLAVCEGIETGLSILLAQRCAVWAALSTSGVRGLVLPDLPLAVEVVICADNDPPGLAAADDAADKWTREGRTVRIAAPEIPGADFNDVLRQVA